MKKFQHIAKITLIVLIFLFYPTFTLAVSTSSSESDIISCQFTLIKLNKYSPEDISAIVDLAYQKSVTEVVNSLYIPYSIVLFWIYQHERKLAHERGEVNDEKPIQLSQTYIDGAMVVSNNESLPR